MYCPLTQYSYNVKCGLVTPVITYRHIISAHGVDR